MKHQHKGYNFTFSAFATARGGNVAMIFGLMLIPMLAFAGAGVDFYRRAEVRNQLIEAVDAASLAIATKGMLNPTMTSAELEAFGQRYVRLNYPGISGVSGLSLNFIISDTKVIAHVTGGIATTFLAPVGYTSLALNLDAEVLRPQFQNIELALILDNTASMDIVSGSKSRAEALQDSVTGMLDILFEGESQKDNIHISVVPFTTMVNVQSSTGFSTSWIDGYGGAAPQALYHGERFFHVAQDGTIDINRKVNHFDIFASTNATPTSWKGCVENRPYPLDELDIAPGVTSPASALTSALSTPSGIDNVTRSAFTGSYLLTNAASIGQSANSYFVPYIAPDEPDCTSNACSFDSPDWYHDPYVYYLHNGVANDYQYTTNSYSATHYQKYHDVVAQFRDALGMPSSDLNLRNYIRDRLDAMDETADEFLWRHAYVGYWNPVSNEYDYKYDLPLLKDEVTAIGDANNEGLNFGCPTAILPLTNARADIDAIIPDLTPRFGGGTNTAIGLVWGWRMLSPGAPFTQGVPYSDSDTRKIAVIMTDGMNESAYEMTGFGYPSEKRLRPDLTNANGENDDKTLRICHRMKEQDIEVYTIVFDVTAGSSIHQVMQACASDPDTHYFDAGNNQALEDAFLEIANSLGNLRISK